jgi:hypothetical protein
LIISANRVAAEGQVQPFWLDTSDGEKLFCWHVLPLDVYLENESELIKAVTTGEVVDGLEGTVGAKLLKMDVESRIVVNFHGVSLLFLGQQSCLFVKVLYGRFDPVLSVVSHLPSPPSKTSSTSPDIKPLHVPYS